MKVADRIKKRRKGLSLRQIDLSSKTGISIQAIRNYERGVSTPKVGYLTKLAKALKCDPAELMSLEEALELRLGGKAEAESVKRDILRLDKMIVSQARDLAKKEEDIAQLRGGPVGQQYVNTNAALEAREAQAEFDSADVEDAPLEQFFLRLRSLWGHLNYKERHWLEIQLKSWESEICRVMPQLTDKILKKNSRPLT